MREKDDLLIGCECAGQVISWASGTQPSQACFSLPRYFVQTSTLCYRWLSYYFKYPLSLIKGLLRFIYYIVYQSTSVKMLKSFAALPLRYSAWPLVFYILYQSAYIVLYNM